jgi:hypothetical protein
MKKEDMTDKMRELLKEKGWHRLQFRGFFQDVHGTENEITGYSHPPTGKYLCLITAIRGDGEYFQSVMALQESEVVDGKVELELIGRMLNKLFLSFSEFENCECVAGKPCEKHKEPTSPNPESPHSHPIHGSPTRDKD